MVNNYHNKGKYRYYTEEERELVLAGLKDGKSHGQLSAELGIPKSTITRWKANPETLLGSGRASVFSPLEEELIVDAVVYSADCGFPYTREKLKDLVKSYAKYVGKNYLPFKCGRPGDFWIRTFERKHKNRLRRRKREGLGTTRAKALSKSRVDRFFTEVYKPHWEKNHLEERPWCLWNCDETIFQASRASGKVYVRAQAKNAYDRQAATTKVGFTVLFCGNAAGQYLDPFIVYRAKGLRLSWMTDGLDNARYSFSDSGWMMDYNFEQWFENVFIPATQLRAPGVQHVLVFDGHNSHISYKTTVLAEANNITLICLPPNTSHALQPFDVGVFKNVKVMYSSLVLNWYEVTNLKSIDKENLKF